MKTMNAGTLSNNTHHTLMPTWKRVIVHKTEQSIENALQEAKAAKHDTISLKFFLYLPNTLDLITVGISGDKLNEEQAR